METHTIRTNLKGFKANCFHFDNLTGFFTYKGREMTDLEVRTIVEWGLQHGYETDADLPGEMVDRIINYINIEPERVEQLKLF